MSGTEFPAFLSARRLPNLFDLAAIICIAGLIFGVVAGARATLTPIGSLDIDTISLDPAYLPWYALRTTIRMFAALACSLFFTFTYATFAAKSRRAGKILVPMLDVLQSVPIIGFLTFTVAFFMSLFPGKILGVELAAIFAIFTSQAWNMAFSMYQSLKTVPSDLAECATAFRLSPWQKFWRMEVPFAMPGLVWNTMMSMSGGWFFVVASEAVTYGSSTYKLPGIGSYVAEALDKGDIGAVLYAILAMLVVILAYDQLLFRPLVAWSAKFRFEMTASAVADDPWMLKLLRRTRLLAAGIDALAVGMNKITGMRLGRGAAAPRDARATSRLGDYAFAALLAAAVAVAAWQIVAYVSATLAWSDLAEAVGLGCYTMIRVVVLMVLATAVWVPIGVWLGLRPKWARRAQPVAQFLAAFPANLFFPIFVLAIVHWNLSANIWLTPLMVLGTQWYILFNVIAGAAAYPGDLLEVSRNLSIGGKLWWQRVMLPGVFSYYVTGAITASGGAWNAAIVAEVVSWKGQKISADGLGAYIANASALDDGMPKVVLGVVVMSAFVLMFNRLIWRPMYAYGARRFNFS